MKRLLVLFTLFVSLMVKGQVENVLPARPNPPRLVNDFTKTLTPEQVQSLEDKLVAFDDSTSSQIAVVIINSLSGYDVSDFALQLGRKWGVGGKDHSNGVVLLVAKDDHKITI